MANINDLKIAINNILDKNFTKMDIYDEEIKQGFDEPCFFVKVLNSTQSKELNRRYKKTIFFDVHYYSDKKDINADCLDMTDKLYEALEYVNVNNNLYKSTGMTHEIVDGVLHFFLEFNYHVFRQIEEVPKMNKLKQEVYLSGRE